MKADVSVGAKPTKNDRRDVRNWVGKLNLRATVDGDEFILAAINRAMFGPEDQAKQLRRSLIAEAKRCYRDHVKK
jgi:hypothetical protein